MEEDWKRSNLVAYSLVFYLQAMSLMSLQAEEQYIIATSTRMEIRCWGEHNKHHFFTLYLNDAVTEFIGGPFNEDMVNSRFQRELESFRCRSYQYFPVYLRGTDSFMGCCGLRQYSDSDKKESDSENIENILEIGFHFLPIYWGKGYATEVAMTMVRYAFDTLGADRVVAGHNPGNSSSKRCLEKIGFIYVKDEYYPPTGLMHPLYSLSSEK